MENTSDAQLPPPDRRTAIGQQGTSPRKNEIAKSRATLASDVKKPFFFMLGGKKKKRYFSVFFFPNFSGIFIISCIICISELPSKE